jgi:hypothetical protein
MEPLLHTPPILQPCSFAPPGLCYPKLPPLRPPGSPWDKPLKLGINRHLPSPPSHVPPRPAQPCTIFTPQACAPKACQARDLHSQDLHSAGPCSPQACQARDPQTRRISTPPACTLQACQAHAPKARYFTSSKGLHP